MSLSSIRVLLNRSGLFRHAAMIPRCISGGRVLLAARSKQAAGIQAPEIAATSIASVAQSADGALKVKKTRSKKQVAKADEPEKAEPKKPVARKTKSPPAAAEAAPGKKPNAIKKIKKILSESDEDEVIKDVLKNDAKASKKTGEKKATAKEPKKASRKKSSSGGKSPEVNKSVEIHREDLTSTRVAERPLGRLGEGYVRLKVEKFALTANTATYAVTGKRLGYWDFFPVSDREWGLVPAVGWGTVVESKLPSIRVGGKYFGWFPMAQYVDIKAAESSHGFRDVGEHRGAHAPAYAEFSRTDLDPYVRKMLVDQDDEDFHCAFRPLFLTAFLIDHFFVEHNYFGAKTVVITSASSKTAVSLAHILKERKEELKLKVVGLTSTKKIEYVVNHAKVYDRVVDYNSIYSIDDADDAVVIDFAGDRSVIEDIHGLFEDKIKYSMAIGLTHHGTLSARKYKISGPDPVPFFAADEMPRLVKKIGKKKFEKNVRDALDDYFESSRDWSTIQYVMGATDVPHCWREVYNGELEPKATIIATLHDPTPGEYEQ